MECHICGSGMEEIVTTLPLKLEDSVVVILKNIPVVQCDGCGEYSLTDTVMERTEVILGGIDKAAELEIVRYAA